MEKSSRNILPIVAVLFIGIVGTSGLIVALLYFPPVLDPNGNCGGNGNNQ